MKKKIAIGIAIIATLFLIFSSIEIEARNRGQEQRASILNFHFEFDWNDDIYKGDFMTISAMESKTEVIEYQDGDSLTLRKRPGRTKYSDLTLEREFDLSDLTFYYWHSTVTEGMIERREFSIVVTGVAGTEVLRFTFQESWPSEYKIYTEENVGLIEKVVITHEKLVIE